MAAATAKNETDRGCQGISYTQIMAAVETFKSAVIRIRDILRSPGVSITGMDSMRHICLYLLSRYMTRAKIGDIGVPEELCWENFMDMLRAQNGGVQKALDLFYHPEIADCLLKHFDRLFDTSDFPFAMKNVHKHKEILEILDGVNMEDVDCQMDILGWVYEQHLRTGSSSASRDLGQFFTDRSICEYMTELCKPTFKSTGVPESVCDPSMGTGGFLTSYIKYFAKFHNDQQIDWSVQQKEIHGCDTDPKVAGVARLNLFMVTGGHRSTNLLTHDSLYGDLPQTGYDVILANMPFGLKGIKHADCCERVKALKIRGTKSEPLFLQLMMVSLNVGGRCAVVVPDGMLVNNSTCHNETRKYLLENFELRKVIKMKGQFFMNTGIQPSILFFENTGNPTQAVEFWDVVRSEKGETTETLLVSVGSERILSDACCSFDMRRYMEVDAPTATTDCRVVALEDICRHENGRALTAADKIEHGEYDVMGGGTTYHAKTNKYNREGETITISKSGTAGYVAFHTKKFWAGDCFTVHPMDEEVCRTKYLYYYLKLNNHLTTANITGSTIPHCKWEDVKGIRIPLPPVATQEEIVATLDRILIPVDIPVQLQADIKAQMATIMRAAVRIASASQRTLEEVLTDVNCKKPVSLSKAEPGPFNLYSSSTSVGKHNEHFFEKGEWIIQGSRGTITDAIFFETDPFIISNNVFVAKKKEGAEEVCLKFVYYQLRLNRCADALIHVNVIPALTKEQFYGIRVSLPSLEIQTSVLARLDALQAQWTALETLRKNAEDNARFVLESYVGSRLVV